MIIYDERYNEIVNPDLDSGYLETKIEQCYHYWIEDVPAEYEESVIREYENGGKDVELRIIKQAQGHWETLNSQGIKIPYDGDYLDDWKDVSPMNDTWTYQIYHTYTVEELAEIKEQERLAAEEQAKLEAQQEFLDKAPNRVTALELGVDDNYEATAELGVEVANQGITLDDIMNAIAELGTIVEGA